MNTMPTPQTTPPFTPEALEILFARTPFKSFQKPGFPSHYWAPLLSACSGTRRDEIFFLTPDDVAQRHGIWVMQIRPNGSQSATSGAAPRVVPVHPVLKKLGFLEFVEERRQTRPLERLFSEYKAGLEHAGMLFSRAFAGWVKTTASRLPADQQHLFGEDFHFPSLRALFQAEAIRSGMSEDTWRRLQGGGLPAPLDPDQERSALERADAEMQQVNIEGCFPALHPYEALTA